MLENDKTRTAAAVPGLPAAGALHAQAEAPGAPARTWFDLQAFVPRLETRLQADPAFSSGSGSLVDVERDLGLSRSGAGAGIAFGRRIGQRWRFEADHLRLQRSGSTVLPRSLQVGDTSCAAGSSIETKAVFQFSRIVGGMSFVQDGSTEFGFAFGGALPRLHLGLRDAGARSFTSDWYRFEPMPMPMPGLFFSSTVAPGWQISGRLEGGAVGDSAFLNLSAKVLWQAAPVVGLGAGLRLLKGHSQADRPDRFRVCNQRFDHQLGGPQLFVNLAF